ncbi:hypothetical protein DUNSADRAFT_7466 [Dunaliella salina]|uniref:Uncharacterized protein n=1 Tax=Dunaliella salina TaxID=3046 RepID=A0ABQ7GLD7_DUNSA|nr:hypothetical protein DUNSADRAFT_7466 [Dunaliella salina]|eukprot:KAF5835381.1 hypothetical protein DUNSADRAFT_7466 [Dunaliella salina]
MSLAKKAAVGVIGAGTVSYGLYFVVQQQDISRHESEVANWSQHVEAEHKAIQNSAKQIQEQEARMKQLSVHEANERAAEKETANKLQEARDVVARLESEYQNKQKSAAKRNVVCCS